MTELRPSALAGPNRPIIPNYKGWFSVWIT